VFLVKKLVVLPTVLVTDQLYAPIFLPLNGVARSSVIKEVLESLFHLCITWMKFLVRDDTCSGVTFSRICR